MTARLWSLDFSEFANEKVVRKQLIQMEPRNTEQNCDMKAKCDDFTIWLHIRITGESQSWHIPFIHAGNLLSNSFFIAAILIQLPNCPLTPSLTCGTDSRLSSVQMYVLDSTRATSRGSVRAKMLREETSFQSKNWVGLEVKILWL